MTVVCRFDAIADEIRRAAAEKRALALTGEWCLAGHWAELTSDREEVTSRSTVAKLVAELSSRVPTGPNAASYSQEHEPNSACHLCSSF